MVQVRYRFNVHISWVALQLDNFQVETYTCDVTFNQKFVLHLWSDFITTFFLHIESFHKYKLNVYFKKDLKKNINLLLTWRN